MPPCRGRYISGEFGALSGCCCVSVGVVSVVCERRGEDGKPITLKDDVRLQQDQNSSEEDVELLGLDAVIVSTLGNE